MDDRATASTIAVLLLVAIAVVMSATAMIFVTQFSDAVESPQYTLVRLETDSHEGTIHARNYAGGAIGAGAAHFLVTVDGVTTEHGVDEFPEFADGSWAPGERICILGPGCAYVHGNQVEVVVVVGGQVLGRLSTWVNAFAIDPDGGIEVLCDGDVFIEIIGVEITDGENGPPIPVFVDYTDDKGATLVPLFSGNEVHAGDVANRYAYAGDILGIRGTADNGAWSSSWLSYDNDPHVAVLIDRDVPPDFKPYGNQTGVSVFMEPFLDSNGLIDLERNQVIILYEFSSDLSKPAADFQDLVVLFTFPAMGCEI